MLRIMCNMRVCDCRVHHKQIMFFLGGERLVKTKAIVVVKIALSVLLSSP